MEKRMEHIAITIDGNRRWAKEKNIPTKEGHAAGLIAVRKLADEMNAAGFKMLTVWVFSTENWKRSEEEVSDYMELLRLFFQKYIDNAQTSDMRVCVIGDLARLDVKLRKCIEVLTELTKDKKGMLLNIAVNYGGRDDIVRATKKIITDGINPDEINETLFSKYLDTAGLPDPDLLVRTGGDLRLSNFMLWQFAYTEFYYCEKYWPDFRFDDLKEAINSFGKRERRFGGRQG